MNKATDTKPFDQRALIRSAAAEYLTFVAASGSSEASVEMRYEDENIWLTQKMMATLYDVSVPAINQHLKRIYSDNELEENAVVKQYLITAADGKNYNTKHYNLQAIIAVGFKIENERAVQFRRWANQIVKDYTIQGWAMDVERLKHGGSILSDTFTDSLARLTGDEQKAVKMTAFDLQLNPSLSGRSDREAWLIRACSFIGSTVCGISISAKSANLMTRAEARRRCG